MESSGLLVYLLRDRSQPLPEESVLDETSRHVLELIRTRSPDALRVVPVAAGHLSLAVCKDIEKTLLAPYPPGPPVFGEQLHWGCLLHRLVAIARASFGEGWPRHVLIAAASAVQSQDLFQLQSTAQTWLAVVSTDTHWALACGSRGQELVRLYDGLQCHEIRNLSTALVVHVDQVWGTKQRVEAAGCLPQKDSWSCGHRLLLIAASLLSQVQSGEAWEDVKVPFSCCTAKAIRELCNTADSEEPTTPKAKRPKREMDAVSSPPTVAKRPAPSRLQSDDNDDGEEEEPLYVGSKRAKSEQDSLVAVKQEKVDQEGQEAMALAEAPASASRVTSRATKKKADKSKGLELVTARGIKHSHFVSVHNKNKDALGKDHWTDFLVCIARKGCMTCTSCKQLRSSVTVSQPLALVPVPEVEADEPVLHTKLVRPGKGKKAATLASYLEKEREGVYTHVSDGCLWWCTVCECEVACRRDTLSGRHKIWTREKSDRHQKALRSKDTGEVVSKTPPLISRVQLAWKGEDLIMRHEACSGKRADGKTGLCKECLSMARSKQLLNDIVSWVVKVDLARYARCLCHGLEEEHRNFVEYLMSRDYYNSSACAKAEIDAVLAASSPLAKLQVLKRKLDSIPHAKRTQGLQMWLDQALEGLQLQGGEESEKRAYKALCSSFCESVAAKVASGGLDANRVVKCLLYSFLDQQSRIDRGKEDRLCTSKYLDDETLQEVWFRLGVGSQTPAILRLFGANPRAVPKVDFLKDCLPQFYLAFLDNSKLQKNCANCLDLLSCSGARDFFLAIDESNYKPTYQVVGGLLKDAPRTIVGGHYCATDDWSQLQKAEQLPEAKQSHLGLFCILARSDTLKHAYCVNVTPMPHGSSGKSHQELQDTEFFSRCSTVKLDIHRLLPFGRLVFQKDRTKHTIFGSLDLCHLMKRMAHHCFSGSRIVHFDEWLVDYSNCLQLGMPVKAFIFSDTQSDKQAFLRLSPTYTSTCWNSFGLHTAQYISALVSSGWEGATGLSTRQRFGNLASAYILLLCNLMLAKCNWGTDWEMKYLPLCTVRNLCYGCALGMSLCVFCESAVRPCAFAEKVAEQFFSRMKAGYRGTASLADCLLGIQKEHLKLSGLSLEVPEESSMPLDLPTANKLFERSFKEAIRFQTWVSRNRKPDELEKQFLLWFQSEGQALLTKGRAEDDDLDKEGEDEDDLPGAECDDLEGDGVPDEAMALLQDVEDHIIAKAQLEDLASSSAVEAEHAEDGEEGTDDEEIGPDVSVVSPAGDKDQHTQECKLTLHGLVMLCDDIETFSMETKEATQAEMCLQRQQQLQPLMRALVLKCREREGYISKAQLRGGVKLQSSYHRLQHELALARAACQTEGSRQSRLATWRTTQKHCIAEVQSKKAADQDMPLLDLTHYKPANHPEYQVILFVDEHKSLQIGMVCSVWRGAVLKKQAQAGKTSAVTRRMRATKPATGPLPSSSCAKIAVTLLTKCADQAFFACSLSPTLLLDPVGRAVGEIKCNWSKSKPDRWLVQLDKAALEAWDHLSKNKELLNSKLHAEPIKGVSSTTTAEIAGPSKILNYNDFSRTLSGTKQIEAFMGHLPRLYKEQAELEILDESGKFLAHGVAYSWAAICRQVPEWFDLTCEGKSTKEYGKSVVSKFLRVIPGEAGFRKRLDDWVRDIVKLAQPVPGAWIIPHRVSQLASPKTV
ncbi:unnamed protein product [Symbiodinium sp. CCMP2592]|nr:unnamed protein product [Symbiodinium sp. CCMP2592]